MVKLLSTLDWQSKGRCVESWAIRETFSYCLFLAAFELTDAPEFAPGARR